MSAYAFVVCEPKASHFGAGYAQHPHAAIAPAKTRAERMRQRKRATRKQRPLFAAYAASGARL